MQCFHCCLATCWQKYPVRETITYWMCISGRYKANSTLCENYSHHTNATSLIHAGIPWCTHQINNWLRQSNEIDEFWEHISQLIALLFRTNHYGMIFILLSICATLNLMCLKVSTVLGTVNRNRFTISVNVWIWWGDQSYWPHRPHPPRPRLSKLWTETVHNPSIQDQNSSRITEIYIS